MSEDNQYILNSLEEQIMDLKSFIQDNSYNISTLQEKVNYVENNIIGELYSMINMHLSWLGTKHTEYNENQLKHMDYQNIHNAIDNKKNDLIGDINEIKQVYKDAGNSDIVITYIMNSSLEEFGNFCYDLLDSNIKNIMRYVTNTLVHSGDDNSNLRNIGNIFNKDIVEFLDNFYSMNILKTIFENYLEIIFTTYTDSQDSDNYLDKLLSSLNIDDEKDLSQKFFEDNYVYEQVMIWVYELDAHNRLLDNYSLFKPLQNLFQIFMDKLIYACNLFIYSFSDSSWKNMIVDFERKLIMSYSIVFVNAFSKINYNVLKFCMKDIDEVDINNPHEFIFNSTLYDGSYKSNVNCSERYFPSILNHFNFHTVKYRYIDTMNNVKHLYSYDNSTHVSERKAMEVQYISRLILLFKYVSFFDSQDIKQFVDKLMRFQSIEGDLDNSLEKSDNLSNFVYEKMFTDVIKNLIHTQYRFKTVFELNESNRIGLNIWRTLPNSVKMKVIPDRKIEPILSETIILKMYKLSQESIEDSCERIKDITNTEPCGNLYDESVLNENVPKLRLEFKDNNDVVYIITMPTYFDKYLFIDKEQLQDSNGSYSFSPHYVMKNNIMDYMCNIYSSVNNYIKLFE
ncbi:hypothetical protein PBI_SCTP2_283 [Salicola phage SCTP-2]|nr:hypothetical protein PBI_SCTP2_283 [Salicola phage SCTP-2]